MTQLTATPNTETASVTLDIYKTADVTKVVRMNVNGTEEVRTSQGQLPSSAAPSIVRTNLNPNPSFETNLNGYTAIDAYGTVTRVATGGLYGSSHLRWTTAAAITTYEWVGSKYSVTLTGGKTYVFSHSLRSSMPIIGYGDNTYGVMYSDPVGLQTGTRIVDASGSTVSSWTWLSKTDEASGWVRYAYKFTVPGTGAQTFDIWMDGALANGAPAGSTIDFDGVLMEEATTASPYFDGDTADISGFDYLWTGTPHASTSTLQTIGGRLLLTDYEAAHGTNTYNVYAADGSMITGSATLVIDKPWLSVPVMPQYSEQVETITQFGTGRESNTTVHRPLGRADSLVVMGKLGDRTGSLEIFCKSYTDARRLERIFERGEVVQLRQRVAEMDMYFTATSIPVSPYSVQGENATRWAMVINYVEVRRPIGNLAGALGWTFDSMASSAASFDVITAHYDTFDALTLGDANV